MSAKDKVEITRDSENHLDKIIKTHETEDKITTRVYEAEPSILTGKATEGKFISKTVEKK